MDNNIIQKCSMKNHKEIEAISYCLECKINMCNKCEKYHQELLTDHHKYKIDKDSSEIFTGLCTEKNHLDELIFFCKTHNKLCCSKCITKIKTEDKGQHTDCTICILDDILNEKKNNLKQNIINLENLSNNLNTSINELKEIFEKANKSKEDLKINVQKIFTDLRNALNEREDNLLLDIDNKYNELFLGEDFIKQCEKLPNKIKKSLEIGKNLEEKWNNIKANLLINDCLNIENNIKDINAINEKIKNYKTSNIDFYFLTQDIVCKELIGIINEFGFITNNHLFDSKILFDQNLVPQSPL